MGKATDIPLNKIRLDGGTQPRASIDDDLVTQYREAMEDNASFPPIEVMFDGTWYWLWDGFHRVHASLNASFKTITAHVQQGTQRDAILASVGANAVHGLRRTNDDKRRAVTLLLKDAEWVKWSDRKIADQCGVSDRFVSSLRTVRGDDRTYTTKHGTTATMKTDNIGKKPGACPSFGGQDADNPKPSDPYPDKPEVDEAREEEKRRGEELKNNPFASSDVGQQAFAEQAMKTKREPTASERWSRIFEDITREMNSVRDLGGIDGLVKTWAPGEIEDYLEALRGYHVTTAKWISTLEKKCQKRKAG